MSDLLIHYRRQTIVGIAIAAAVLSPPDPFSMIAMMLPTIAVYEAAIQWCRWRGPKS